MRIAWPRRFLGLPLHPMLVHIPFAFWLSVPFFDLLALVNGLEPWWIIALWATAVGVVVGALALVSGLLDYIHLSDTGSNDVRLAARHGVRTAAVWCVMCGKLIAAGVLNTHAVFVWTVLVIDVLACALLLQGMIFGTRITYGGYGR